MTEPGKFAPEAAMGPRKVAILGTAPSTRDMAPYDDESWEIWSLSNLVMTGGIKRWTTHFELHSLRRWRDDPKNIAYFTWMCAQEKPIYLQEACEKIPNGIAYPKDEIIAIFGTYFQSTVCWMLALAIHQKVDAIGVWGIDMAMDTEYAEQRPSCERLIGWAQGVGIKVFIPPESDLLKARGLYGFELDDDSLHAKWHSRKTQLEQQIKEYTVARDTAALKAAHCQGALDMTKYFGQFVAK